ncbi:MAG: 3-dehydroquinate synthase [Caldilineaceae bacterium]|nr:3-dehydroquinate synthase [Caldilineaceae bacterium]
MTTQTDARNIILTGFMGTGKSTIGRHLATRLGRSFIDMDEQLQAHFGKPIREVFAQEGEGVFRTAEAQLCAQLAEQSGLVISTGGGALVNTENRAALAATGILLCLTANVDEILRRVAATGERPLLNVPEAEQRQRIQALLNSRRAAYGAIPHQIDTTGYTPEALVEQVIETLAGDAEVAGMTRLKVQGPTESYHICIGEGIIAEAGRLLSNRGLRPGPAAVVTNAMIAPQHGEQLLSSLRNAGFQPTLCLVPEGEQHKTLATIADLYDQFLAAGLDRNSPIIALGGGVVGDMTGFAAATYLRGAPFIQIPTTLLSMVDASVGGKTGVDLPQGKNLVGAFKQPHVVLIDVDVLQSLPAAEFRSGLAEVIKHGIIGAPDLFVQFEGEGPTSLKHLVTEAVRVKINVVEEDPFEQGRRAVLNLGHTFGHAMEQVSHFSIRHGEGVAVGMVAATHMAAAIGRCDATLVTRVRAVLERVGLPVQLTGYDPEEVLAAMGHDKKRAGKTLRFVIPQGLGDVVVIDNPGMNYVMEALQQVLR